MITAQCFFIIIILNIFGWYQWARQHKKNFGDEWSIDWVKRQDMKYWTNMNVVIDSSDSRSDAI